MNQQNKWQQELDKLTDTAFKKTDSELFNLYRNKLIEIKKVVKHYTDIYPDLSFSKKLEIERQLQVGNEIQNILASVDKDVHQSVKDFAVNQGNLGYNGVFYAMEGAENITTPMTVINQKYIVNALNKPVAGKRLSKRLYQNRDHLSKVSTQALIDGLWDGNGYAEVAKRITDQTEASYRQSLRIARTEGGRVRSVTTQQGYDDAADMGIQFEKEWLATSDSRTRHDHTVLDGQRVEPDDEFEIAGNHAVGPRLFGIAREDINCRCTTISVVKDVPNEFKNAEGASISHDNYDNWLKSKQDLKKPELSDQELVEKYLNEDFVDKLGYNRVNDIARRLEHAPENMQNLWLQFKDDMKFERVGGIGHESYYLGKTRKVTTTKLDVDALGSSSYLGKYDVVYHEFGHMIDHAATGWLSDISSSSHYDMGATMRSDLADYCKKLGSEIATNINPDELKHFGLDPKNVYTYRGVRVKVTKSGKLDATSQRKLAERQLLHDLHSADDWPTYGDASDMIEAATGARLKPGVGHGAKYWAIDGMEETEAFAEMTSATINNPASLEMINKIFPNGYEQYLQMVTDILKKGEH